MAFLKRLSTKKEEERNKTDEKILEATLANDPGKLKLLIGTKKHTSLSKPDEEGRIPLFEACKYGFKECVEILLTTEPETSSLQDEEGRSPLHIATIFAFPNCVSALLKKGVSPDLVDKKGKTALHYAAFAGQMEILQTLVAYNADTEKRDFDGNTPLLCAAQANQLETAKNLVNNSSNVNAQNRQLKSALMYACQHGSVESAKLYLSHGAKLDMKDTGDRTAFAYAKLSGNPSLIDIFPPDAPLGGASPLPQSQQSPPPPPNYPPPVPAPSEVFNPFGTTTTASHNAFDAGFADAFAAPPSFSSSTNGVANDAKLQDALAKNKILETQIEALKAQLQKDDHNDDDEGEVNFDSDEDVDLESSSKAKPPPNKETVKEIARLKAKIADLEDKVARTGAEGAVVPVVVLEQLKEEYAASIKTELNDEKAKTEKLQNDLAAAKSTSQSQKEQLVSLQLKLGQLSRAGEELEKQKKEHEQHIESYRNLVLRLFEGKLSAEAQVQIADILSARTA